VREGGKALSDRIALRNLSDSVWARRVWLETPPILLDSVFRSPRAGASIHSGLESGLRGLKAWLFKLPEHELQMSARVTSSCVLVAPMPACLNPRVTWLVLWRRAMIP